MCIRDSPTLKEVLTVFSKHVQAGSFIALDFKGKAQSAAVLAGTVGLARLLGIEKHMFIYVLDYTTNASQQLISDVHQLLAGEEMRVRYLWGARDRTALHWEPAISSRSRLKSAGVSAVSASVMFSDVWYARVSGGGMPLFVWVVDTKAHLEDCVRRGVNAVISNHPLEMKRVLQQAPWCT
eukprot:TRINITY_DN28517_c0_g1_i2.p1 TRINITY_DN28517_c0_g1~~TRINITY_DN28517_c0_g1_i2.p1  ORF type:complete len:181 (-),score=55.75 TRINITY_DN28517_c0_g1_i2:105-647(-)